MEILNGVPSKRPAFCLKRKKRIFDDAQNYLQRDIPDLDKTIDENFNTVNLESNLPEVTPKSGAVRQIVDLNNPILQPKLQVNTRLHPGGIIKIENPNKPKFNYRKNRIVSKVYREAYIGQSELKSQMSTSILYHKYGVEQKGLSPLSKGKDTTLSQNSGLVPTPGRRRG